MDQIGNLYRKQVVRVAELGRHDSSISTEKVIAEVQSVLQTILIVSIITGSQKQFSF